MLVHHRVIPSIKFAGTHLYTWVERGTVRVKCLVHGHKVTSPARSQTQTAQSGVERTSHEATTAPHTCFGGGGEEHLYAHFPEQRLIIEPTCTTANCLFNSRFWFQVHRLNIKSDCVLLLDSHCTYSLKKSLSHYSYQRYWLPVTEVHNVDFISSSCMIRYSYFHSWCAHVRQKSQIWSAWQMFAKLSVTITLSRDA